MRATDSVWRILIDEALRGRRAWPTAAELAWRAGAGEQITHKALRRPTSIGAITRHPGGGFSLTDPERLLTLLSAARSLNGAARTTMDAAQGLIARAPAYAIGGTRAAAQHLGGRNMIADHAEAIVYVCESTDIDHLPAGEEALVFQADGSTMAYWNLGYTSPAQTYADLFAQPGRQASEFRRALWRAWFSIDDWSKAEREQSVA